MAITTSKIIKVRWFSGRTTIGIIIVKNEIEEKAYIGTVDGFNEDRDIKYIKDFGVKFPLKVEKQL